MKIKTKAYILKRYDVNDYDNHLLFFTEELGRIKAVAKGIKHQKAKMAGYLQFFSELELTLLKSRRSFIIIGANIYSNNIDIARDWPRAKVAWYFLSIINNLVLDNEKNLKIYNSLKKALFLLKSKIVDSQLEKLLWAFMIRIIFLTGYLPSFNKCYDCDINVKYDDMLFFDIKKGGVLCLNCAKKFYEDKRYSLNKEICLFIESARIFDEDIFLNLPFRKSNFIFLRDFINYHILKFDL